MAEILHQLISIVPPIIYKVSYIPGGAGFFPSTVLLSPFKRQLYHTVEKRQMLPCALRSLLFGEVNTMW